MPFVQLISQLQATDIEYPVSGSNWINNEFRVCFRLPNDDDYEEIGESYRYENIELEVNGKVFTMKSSIGATSGALIKPGMFSTSTLTYRNHMVVYPNLYGDITASANYRIRVRVKKSYSFC